MRRLCALQLLGGSQAGVAVVAEQLVAGQGIVDQAAQAVVQAQLAGVVGCDAALAQVFQQRQACSIGLRCPVSEQLGLLRGLGGEEEFALAGVGCQGISSRSVSRSLSMRAILEIGVGFFARKPAPTGISPVQRAVGILWERASRMGCKAAPALSYLSRRNLAACHCLE